MWVEYPLSAMLGTKTILDFRLFSDFLNICLTLTGSAFLIQKSKIQDAPVSISFEHHVSANKVSDFGFGISD